MKNTVALTLLDLANNYTTNAKLNDQDFLKDMDQLSELAQEDVSSLNGAAELLTFIAFQIKDSEEIFDKYKSLCSSILIVTGKLPYHLLCMSQNMDVFLEYYVHYQEHVQKRLHEMEIANIF